MLIFDMIGAVGTAVDAVVGQIQRSEHDNPVAVKILFDLLRKLEDLFIFFLDLTGKQHRCFPVRKALPELRLFDQSVDHLYILLVLVCVGECVQNFLVVDKIIRTF